MHKRAHDEELRERRGDTLVVRGLSVHSRALGLSGKCDVVEFHKDTHGHPLAGEDGLWRAVPVEYKRGSSKANDADRLQLCAQALCLEEMLGADVPLGSSTTAKRVRAKRWSSTSRCAPWLARWRRRCMPCIDVVIRTGEAFLGLSVVLVERPLPAARHQSGEVGEYVAKRLSEEEL